MEDKERVDRSGEYICDRCGDSHFNLEALLKHLKKCQTKREKSKRRR